MTNHVPKDVTAKHYLLTSLLQYLQPEVQQVSNWLEHEGRLAEAEANGANVARTRS